MLFRSCCHRCFNITRIKYITFAIQYQKQANDKIVSFFTYRLDHIKNCLKQPKDRAKTVLKRILEFDPIADFYLYFPSLLQKMQGTMRHHERRESRGDPESNKTRFSCLAIEYIHHQRTEGQAIQVITGSPRATLVVRDDAPRMFTVEIPCDAPGTMVTLVPTRNTISHF